MGLTYPQGLPPSRRIISRNVVYFATCTECQASSGADTYGHALDLLDLHDRLYHGRPADDQPDKKETNNAHQDT